MLASVTYVHQAPVRNPSVTETVFSDPKFVNSLKPRKENSSLIAINYIDNIPTKIPAPNTNFSAELLESRN